MPGGDERGLHSVLPLDMVDKSISPLQPHFGPVFGDEAVQRTFSSQREAPSEPFCGYIHPSACDMIQPPIWLVSLSSGNRWQGASEHLASRPASGGSASCHPRRPAWSQCPNWAASRIEIHIQAVTGKERKATRGEHLSQGVNNRMCCVRGPSSRTGRSLVQGSIASHSQSTRVERRSRVRISSNCRCGRCRLRKERSCKAFACSPARDSQVVMVV